jgi:hypothetical protein
MPWRTPSKRGTTGHGRGDPSGTCPGTAASFRSVPMAQADTMFLVEGALKPLS